MTLAARFMRSQSGGTAAEFAMVLPLLLLFLFGIIDGGRKSFTTSNPARSSARAAAG